MKIVISGYGRMGHEVEKVASARNHKIIASLDDESDWSLKKDIIKTADIIIDFSLPETAVDVFEKSFKLGIPIVTGTTGWYNEMERVQSLCNKYKASFFFSPNFSIGMNIFFQANKLMAKLSAASNVYKASMEETHHIHKMDSPSGTAIKIANDIIEEFPSLDKWKNDLETDDNQLSIVSYRKGEVIGDHSVKYESEVDLLEISHHAKSRKGFALGAVMAAEFMIGKKGFYSMNNLMDELQNKEN